MTIEEEIRERIQGRFAPEYLEVINESAKHAGHSGDDGSGESHFKLIVASKIFENTSRIERHKMVFDVLSDLVSDRIHALTLDLRAPE